LEECGVEYESRTVDLQDKPRDFVNLYARANPIPGARAKVPLLHARNEKDDDDHDDFVLCESLVVAEYVAEVFGRGEEEEGSLWPESPEDRARVRLFTDLCGSAFSYFPLARAVDDEKKFDAALESFKEGLSAADAFLREGCGGGGEGEGPFLLGDRFSLAECNAAPFVQRCRAILPAFTGTAKVDPLQLCEDMGLRRLGGWMEAVLSRPSVVRTGVPEDDMRESTTKMLERFAAMEKAGGSTSK